MYEWHRVAIAGMEGLPECIHRAYLDPAIEWNGWACPFFEKSEVLRMNVWLTTLDDGLEYSSDNDSFATTYDSDNREVFAASEIDGMKLYPVGYGSWTWCIVD